MKEEKRKQPLQMPRDALLEAQPISLEWTDGMADNRGWERDTPWHRDTDRQERPTDATLASSSPLNTTPLAPPGSNEGPTIRSVWLRHRLLYRLFISARHDGVLGAFPPRLVPGCGCLRRSRWVGLVLQVAVHAAPRHFPATYFAITLALPVWGCGLLPALNMCSTLKVLKSYLGSFFSAAIVCDSDSG